MITWSSPRSRSPGHEARRVVGLGWFVPKDVRADDRVTFSGDAVDAYGTRCPIEYEFSAARPRVAAALADLARGAAALGELVPGRGQTLVPAGSRSTTRERRGWARPTMAKSSATVVARLGLRQPLRRGQRHNPTSTASNPTLTSVALAIRAAEAVA